jgi:hypothetical protein
MYFGAAKTEVPIKRPPFSCISWSGRWYSPQPEVLRVSPRGLSISRQAVLRVPKSPRGSPSSPVSFRTLESR